MCLFLFLCVCVCVCVCLNFNFNKIPFPFVLDTRLLSLGYKGDNCFPFYDLQILKEQKRSSKFRQILWRYETIPDHFYSFLCISSNPTVTFSRLFCHFILTTNFSYYSRKKILHLKPPQEPSFIRRKPLFIFVQQIIATNNFFNIFIRSSCNGVKNF